MGRSRPAPAPARRSPPPPAPAQRTPPPPAAAPTSSVPAAPMAAPAQSAGGGFLSTMVQGFAFGTGSSIAREAVHSVMGGSNQSAPAPAPQMDAPMQRQQIPQGPCAIDNEALMNCLRANSGNAGACEFYFNALQTCQSSHN